MSNPFNWRGQPSCMFSNRKPPPINSNPKQIKYGKALLTGSIATAEKHKQRPGVGRMATA